MSRCVAPARGETRTRAGRGIGAEGFRKGLCPQAALRREARLAGGRRCSVPMD